MEQEGSFGLGRTLHISVQCSSTRIIVAKQQHTIYTYNKYNNEALSKRANRANRVGERRADAPPPLPRAARRSSRNGSCRYRSTRSMSRSAPPQLVALECLKWRVPDNSVSSNRLLPLSIAQARVRPVSASARFLESAQHERVLRGARNAQCKKGKPPFVH